DRFRKDLAPDGAAGSVPDAALGAFEDSVMPQARYALACRLRLLRIDVGPNHAGLGAGLGENLAPWRNDQRVAVCAPAVGVLSALRRRNHEGAVLDSAGAQQNVPVRLACGLGEGARHR